MGRNAKIIFYIVLFILLLIVTLKSAANAQELMTETVDNIPIPSEVFFDSQVQFQGTVITKAELTGYDGNTAYRVLLDDDNVSENGAKYYAYYTTNWKFIRSTSAADAPRTPSRNPDPTPPAPTPAPAPRPEPTPTPRPPVAPTPPVVVPPTPEPQNNGNGNGNGNSNGNNGNGNGNQPEPTPEPVIPPRPDEEEPNEEGEPDGEV